MVAGNEETAIALIIEGKGKDAADILKEINPLVAI